MAAEHERIINEILLNLPKNQRLFKSRAGTAWQGKYVRKGNIIIMKNPVPFYGMPDGFPDTCGWTEIEITSDMVDQKIAVFTAVEIKVSGKLTKDQEMFKDLIEGMGGIYNIIRS